MRYAAAFALVSVVVLSASSARSEDPPGAAAVNPESGKAAPQMIVVKDPQTGELRAPTAAEIAALKAAAASQPAPKASVAGQTTTVEKLLSGRVRAKLGPEYMRYSVVRKNPDGSLAEVCVPAGKVEAALKAPATAVKKAPAPVAKAEEK